MGKNLLFKTLVLFFIFYVLFLINKKGLNIVFAQYAPTATNTPIPPTPTNTPTPTPIGKWIKLKNSSFSSGNTLTNPIPAVVASYDADDDGTRYFNIASANYDPGLVSASSINLGTAPVSTKSWQVNLTKTVSMTPLNFLNYVKARKEYATLSAIGDITTNDYNNEILVSNNSLIVDDTNKANFNSRNLVLVINGDLTINSTLFQPTAATTAFIVTGTITFADTTTTANGIFIAPTINTGTSTDLGLKIKGNLIAQTTLTNNRKWTSNTRPSLFIIVDKDQYLSLLSYLSVANYSWQQLK